MIFNLARGALTSARRLDIFRSSVVRSGFVGVQSCSTKYYSNDAVKESNDVVEESNKYTNPGAGNFDLKDPVKGSLVYVGTISKIIRYVKLISVSTTVFAASMQPLLLKQILSNNDMSFGLIFTSISAGAVMLSPMFLHLLTKRYVESIYYNVGDDTFTATTYNILALRKQEKFTPKDVTIPRSGSVFSTVIVKGKKHLFFDPSLFLDKDAFVRLMRYDEPLEWEIHQDENDKKSN